MNRRQHSAALSPTSTPTRSSPWLTRRTLVAGALVLLAHLAGLFTPVDRWVIGHLSLLRGSPSRAAMPLLVAIDDATVDRLGPPPWSGEVWADVSLALAGMGAEQAFLVDAWPPLVEGEARTPAGGAQILVPRLIVDNPGSPALPLVLDPPDTAPFTSWSHQLSLPAAPDGVVRGLSDASNNRLFGPSAFCAWTHCPSGLQLSQPLAVPRRGAVLPTVSLADLLSAVRLPSESEVQRRTVLIGVTDPWRAHTVRAGPNATLTTWPEAVGYAVASARTWHPTPPLDRLRESLLLIVVLLASMVIRNMSHTLDVGLAIVSPPVLFTGLATTAILGHIVLLPWTAIVLASVLPTILASMASRELARRFLSSVALSLAEDGFRYAWRDTRVRTPRDIASRVIALTRARFPTVRSAWLQVVRGGRVRWAGGDGLAKTDFFGELRLDSPELRAAAAHEEGSRIDTLVTASAGRALPVREGGQLAGFWVVAWSEGTTEPDPTRLVALARWLGLRIALYEESRLPTLRERLRDRLESDTERVRELYATASEERRRQLEALHSLEIPLITADLSGAVLFANRSMTRLLADLGQSQVTSLQDLLGAVAGHDLSADLHRLFTAGEPVAVRWQSEQGAWRITAQPVAQPLDDGEEEILGYVAHVDDLSQQEQLEDMRASVVNFANTRVRNALMVVVGYAGLLRAKSADDPVAQRMLDTISRNAADVTTAMDELKSLAGLETEPSRLIEMDLMRAAREVVRDLASLAADRDLTLELDGPEIPLPVLAPAGRTRDALSVLLSEACVEAEVGSRVQVALDERPEETAVLVTWRGPGFDSALLEGLQGDWHTDLGGLPRELHPFARVRTAFPDLVLRSSAGAGVEVRFALRRAGRL